MNKQIQTLKDGQRFDELVESFLYPSHGETDLIGELSKAKAKKSYYAFADGVYYEAPTRLRVAQKLATKHINR